MVRGFVDALDLVKEIAEPVVDALGGVGKDQSSTLLGRHWMKALLGFGGMAAASRATATSMVARCGGGRPRLASLLGRE